MHPLYVRPMVFLAKQTMQPNISGKTDSLSVVPSQVVRNLGVMIDEQLTLSEHVASVTRSRHCALFNKRKITLFLTQQATRLLVQTMVIIRPPNGLPGSSDKTTTEGLECGGMSGFRSPEKGMCFVSYTGLPVKCTVSDLPCVVTGLNSDKCEHLYTHLLNPPRVSVLSGWRMLDWRSSLFQCSLPGSSSLHHSCWYGLSEPDVIFFCVSMVTQCDICPAGVHHSPALLP